MRNNEKMHQTKTSSRHVTFGCFLIFDTSTFHHFHPDCSYKNLKAFVSTRDGNLPLYVCLSLPPRGMIRNCSSYLIFPLVPVRNNESELMNLYESFHFHLFTGSVLRRRHTSGLKAATYVCNHHIGPLFM